MSQQTSGLGMQAWQLRKGGQYMEAIELYTQLYRADGSSSHLRNRGLIYLDIEDYVSALEDFKSALVVEDSRFRGAGDYLFQGVCFWHLNDPDQAVSAWQEGLGALYTDAAGGVEAPAVLLYAAERLHRAELRKESLTVLRKLARRKLRSWPGAIVPFLLEQIDIARLENDINAAGNDTLIGRRRCQADFYIALRALRARDQAAFQAGMIRCATSRYGHLEHETYLARWEVKHQFPDPAYS
jgi:tetratricopeptide (TPR) repeat protein